MNKLNISTWILLLSAAPMLAQPRFHAGGPAHDGEEITCYFPTREHLRNDVGKDDLGLCVFTSLEMAGIWCGNQSLLGLRDFMKNHPGGGWPEKVDRYLKIRDPQHTIRVLHHLDGDAEFLQRALAARQYVCVTYEGRDGIFYRSRVAHMVNLVHFSKRWAVIQDNNYPGKWLWMSPEDFLARWRGINGGWAMILLQPGPPPALPQSTHVVCTITAPHPIMPLAAPVSGVICGQPSRNDEYMLGGQAISRQEVFERLEALQVQQQRPSLTFLGSMQQQSAWHAVLQQPTFRTLQEQWCIRKFPQDSWLIRQGFQPGVVLQNAPDRQYRAAIRWHLASPAGGKSLQDQLEKELHPRLPEPVEPEPDRVPEREDRFPQVLSQWGRKALHPSVAWTVLGYLLGNQFFVRRNRQ
ncbi:MAG: hypothetical protein R3B84_17320 [Zavarzinella sp.]